MSEINDPLTGPSGLTFTPFHLIVLLFACLSLVVSQLGVPSDLQAIVGMWRRAMVLLVLGTIVHGIVSSRVQAYRAQARNINEEYKLKRDIKARSKLRKQPNAWEDLTSHPSQFLTTRDGKPRLFPFPLGKAGGDGPKGQLWWEAGNSAHVGHFNQKETPEAREALRHEMEDKEEERQRQAKKAHYYYLKARNRWGRRLGHLKMLSGIIVLGLVHRKAAVVCLAGLIYYVLASELMRKLLPDEDLEAEDDRPTTSRKKVPQVPGMGMTYIYEPTRAGGVREAGSFPVKAPSNRLLTSTDNRYAS